MITRSASRAGALLIPIAIAIAACGGATTSSSPGATSGAGASAAPTTAAATPTAQPSGAQASTAPSFPIAIPSFDIGALTRGLENVDSYKVSISLNGEEQIKGVVVTKPELARDYTLKDGTRLVVIGDKAWMAQSGDGALTSVPGTLVTGMFAAYDPTLLVAAFSGPQWAQSSANQGTEQKNGVEATHYHIDSTTAAAMTGFPAGAKVDLWISNNGVLVALEATGFQMGDLSIQVTAIDDPANKVETPS